ncbi:MAG: T9SS C-terminal target domain-containing protein [Bacteroidetes bacterium]|nr:MAG: T9SS C-terminal target domain-containing protein [Bacteroidota bacterium]
MSCLRSCPENEFFIKSMHNMKNIVIFLAGSIFCSLLATRTMAQQKWLQMADTSSNFNLIKNAFLKENKSKLRKYYQELRKSDKTYFDETYQAEHESEEFKDITHFFRVAEWLEPRVSETNGDIDAVVAADYKARIKKMGQLEQLTASNWTVVGPVVRGNMFANGRVNSIKVDPNNTSTLYAGTPAGQLWKSTNNGGTWSVISSGIPAAGVTTIAIDPTNSNIIYAVTGDADRSFGQPSSRGLYKSTDGGTTWAVTGLATTISAGIIYTDIIIHPTTPSIVMVSGTNGIWRSVNGGTSFTRVENNASIRELVFNPLRPATIFAASKTGGKLLRSYDAGVTWTQLTSGLPASSVSPRFSIDISPVDTNYVYLMATNNAHGMEGFYRSVNAGNDFVKMASTPNIPDEQGWYNLAVVADPTIRDLVYAGGIFVYRSTNGGATFTDIGCGHVDVHDLNFNGNTLLVASDGGVYRYSGTDKNWTNMSSNLSIAQPYGIGLSTTNANLMISGHQDAGTNLTTDGITWRPVSGGDGMISFIDRTNNARMYCTFQNGVLRRSTNSGTNFTTIKTVAGGFWVTPFIQDPIDANTLYTGGDVVEKSIDGGTTWTTISPANGQVRWIDVCTTNNQIIYYVTNTATYKTTDGGANWTNVTGTVPATTRLSVHIDVNDPNTVYVTLASTGTNQVFRTADAGATWTNISAGLPPVAATTIVTQRGILGVAYCGTDIGVYYRDPALNASWQPYSNNLPVVPIRDLEINYSNNRIRAATFGRSVWESSLSQVLPVNLKAFSGVAGSLGIYLTWQTVTETGFDRFEIERSLEGSNWGKIATEAAKGSNASYEVTDENPANGVNYYRLKMMDKDGKYTYSKIVNVKWNKGNAKPLAIYPNPAKDKVFLAGNELVADDVTARIVDMSGKVVMITTVKNLRNGLQITNLPKGTYFLEIADATAKKSLQFIVEH